MTNAVLNRPVFFKKILAGRNAVIVVLAGGLRRTKKGWRTSNFNESGDNFGICGSRLRVLAAAELYNLLSNFKTKILIIASGGKGQYQGIKGAPFLSAVLKKELIELGVPGNKILEEKRSNNTCQQLEELARIVKDRNLKNIILISNKYHLPRIKAFIEVDKKLRKIFAPVLKIRSAEEILIAANPKKWEPSIKKGYSFKSMKERIILEKKGEKQIRNGTYSYKTDYSGKIKTAIIGLGRIAWSAEEDGLETKVKKFPTHFSVLRDSPDFKLVAVQDNDVVARKSFFHYAKKFGHIPEIYGNWEEMIKRENLDLLVVASNTESHFDICSRAIDLGIKNILCEKPISYSVKETRNLVKKAEKAGCVLFVNYHRAFNYSYTELIKKIKAGFLGKIQSFDARYSRGIFNNGTHLLDILIRMFGEVEMARGFKNQTCSILEKDPTISAALKFKNNVSGYMHGLNTKFYDFYDLDIMGESGRISIVYDKAKFFIRQKSGAFKGYSGLKIQPRMRLIDIKDGLRPVYENIYSCIKSKDKNKCPGNDALRSLTVADKIIKSAKI